MICFLTFNFFNINNFYNGPGISLWGLCNSLDRFKIEYKIFSLHNSTDSRALPIRSIIDNKEYIDKCKYIILWSGLTPSVLNYLKLSIFKDKEIILGPNLIDGVNLEKESSVLSSIEYDKILVPNKKIKYKVNSAHNIELNKIFEFMSPPDLTYWSVPSSKERYVLWKGNEKHIVKNSDFAKVVLNKLNKKKIENKFLTNYNYMHHIREASRAGIYISTSKSESISMTMLEQMHCGTPCIINPGHYLWGVNYETSIMSNLNINEYVENIEMLYHNEKLRRDMSEKAHAWASQNFCEGKVIPKFLKILESKC